MLEIPILYWKLCKYMLGYLHAYRRSKSKNCSEKSVSFGQIRTYENPVALELLQKCESSICYCLSKTYDQSRSRPCILMFTLLFYAAPTSGAQSLQYPLLRENPVYRQSLGHFRLCVFIPLLQNFSIPISAGGWHQPEFGPAYTFICPKQHTLKNMWLFFFNK